MNNYIINMAQKSRKAQQELILLNTKQKNQLLEIISNTLLENIDLIIRENKLDVELAIKRKMEKSFIDRLLLTEERIRDISKTIIEVVEQEDPIGKVLIERDIKSGLRLKQITEPMGVLSVIYEARPNVTIDVSVLSLKSSNAVLLRGSKDTINSNKVIVDLIRNAIKDIVNPDVIQLVEDIDRKHVKDILNAKGQIDLVIPRGSQNLIDFVVKEATVPVIETGAGVTNMYIDSDFNLEWALEIINNAKTQRVSVCNSLENLLIHKDSASELLPKLKELLNGVVELRGCSNTKKIIEVKEATEEDYFTEYLDYILSIKIVNNLEEAIDFINIHSTKHSEAIISSNQDNIDTFMSLVDSSTIYSNASTRFSDGEEFGFGAEVGISTQKLHARGPFGLDKLTTIKNKVYGSGNTRK